jgi:hypothetical protein
MADQPRPAGASSQCPHTALHFHLNNATFGDSNLHYLEVTITCTVCGIDMLFRGVPAGLSPDHPTASIDGKELRLPFIGEGEELKGRPAGFSVSIGGTA